MRRPHTRRIITIMIVCNLKYLFFCMFSFESSSKITGNEKEGRKEKELGKQKKNVNKQSIQNTFVSFIYVSSPERKRFGRRRKKKSHFLKIRC